MRNVGLSIKSVNIRGKMYDLMWKCLVATEDKFKSIQKNIHFTNLLGLVVGTNTYNPLNCL